MNDHAVSELVTINGRTYSLRVSSEKNLEIIPQFSPFKSEHLMDVQEIVHQHAFNNISVTVKEAHQTAHALRPGMFAAQRDMQIIFNIVGGELVPQTSRTEYLFESLPQKLAVQNNHEPMNTSAEPVSKPFDNNVTADSYGVAR